MVTLISPHEVNHTVRVQAVPANAVAFRYYGPAITSERSVDEASTRVTINQLILVALGSLLASWDYKAHDAVEASTVILSAQRCLSLRSNRVSKFPVSKYKTVKKALIRLRYMNEDWVKNFDSGPNWIRALAEAASSIHEAKDLDREICLRLVALGMGSGSSFIAEKGTHSPPVFGLAEFSEFIAALETDEDRIAILRKYAALCFPNAPLGKVIIRYNPDSPRKMHTLSSEEATPFPSEVSSDASSDEEELDATNTGFQGKQKAKALAAMPRRGISIDTADRSPYRDENKKRRRLLSATTQKKRQRKHEQSAEVNESLENNEEKSDDTGDAAMPTISVQPAEDNEPDAAMPQRIPYEYATALPAVHRDSSSSGEEVKNYYRWFDSRIVPFPVSRSSIFDSWPMMETLKLKSVDMLALDLEDPVLKRDSVVLKESHDPARDSGPNTSAPFIAKNPTTFEVQLGQNEDLDPNEASQSSCPITSGTTAIKYEFFVGDPEIAAIFVAVDLHEEYEHEARMPYWATKKRPWKKKVETKDIQLALDNGAISAQTLDATLRHQDRFNYTRSLMALAAVQDAYRELHSATIDPRIALKPFHTATCLEGYRGLRMGAGYQPPPMTREQAFACITLLETGSLDLPSETFLNVFAISSADSLYVASQLLCDPGSTTTPHNIQRIIGNVGRAGVSLLVPPAELQVLKPQPDNWRVINHALYDGTQGDYFSETSLHLSFSGWSTTVGPAVQGRRDIEVSLVESLVSVYDREKWIADLDILSALKKGHSQHDHEFFFKSSCEHDPFVSGAEFREMEEEYKASVRLTAIDSWAEFLDRPSGPCVVRASNNRLAKLATAVLGVYKGDRVLVGDRICWVCYKELDEFGGSAITEKVTFII
jgi:hypothetical protein